MAIKKAATKKAAPKKAAAPKTNRSKKSLGNRAKVKKSVLTRRRVRARKSKGK
jgi:hypothetical protein